MLTKSGRGQPGWIQAPKPGLLPLTSLVRAMALWPRLLFQSGPSLPSRECDLVPRAGQKLDFSGLLHRVRSPSAGLEVTLKVTQFCFIALEMKKAESQT